MASAAIQKISKPFDLPQRACRMAFVHTTRYEETDNAIATAPKKSFSNKYRRVARGTLVSTPSGSDEMAWHLEVTRMEINGNPVGHRQAALTTGQFITDHHGDKTNWQIRLPAYEDTGASRFFSSERLAGLKADTRELAEDLVPKRLKSTVRTGSMLLRINVQALPELRGLTDRVHSSGLVFPAVDNLVLTTDGWRQYRGRRVLMASAQRRFEGETRQPVQHFRLAVEAIYLLDGSTGCPIAGYLNLDLQTRYLSYTKHTRLWKEMDYQLLN